MEKYGAFRNQARMLNLDPKQFVPGIDLEMMYYDMYWAAQGYIWENVQSSRIDVDKMEKDFMRLLDFWKSVYLKKQSESGGHVNKSIERKRGKHCRE